MKKNSRKKPGQLFVLKTDAYTFKQGQIFELVEEKVNLPRLTQNWVVVTNEDFHNVHWSQYQFRETYYIQDWLLEPIGYL